MFLRHVWWLLVIPGCATDPIPGDGGAPTGAPIVVHLVGGGFVEVDGRRETVEDLVYELRVRCRAAVQAGIAHPWLRIVAPQDASDDLGDLSERLRRAAHDAGVRHVELALEGA